MTQTETQSSVAGSRVYERWLIGTLCVVAMVHVLIFAAAFPFFGPTDEESHFDLVLKYSHMQVPRRPEIMSEESFEYITLFSSWEYIFTKDTQGEPLWKMPWSKAKPIVMAREIDSIGVNPESPQPPLYYLLAGAWWNLGRVLGFHDIYLLYWLRFLNALFVGALVWLAWHAARLVFPDTLYIRIAVPAVLALMSQSIFYSIDNDVLSPLCFGVVFICLVRLWGSDNVSIPPGVATGLALAATFLAKSTNLPLLAVAGLFLIVKIWTLLRRQKLHGSLTGLALMIISAAAPALVWMVWCKVHFGTFLGSATTARLYGWTVKPVSQWFHHPIFTPHGLWIFFVGNINSFWQGEMIWHARPMILWPVRWIYLIVSVVFVALAAGRVGRLDKPQRCALVFALAGAASLFLFYAFLSIIYDFHGFPYPSRAHPYFISGRLMLGTLIPFLLMFAYGMDAATKYWHRAAKYALLAAFLLFMLGSEIVTDWPVFFSQYNWFNA